MSARSKPSARTKPSILSPEYEAKFVDTDEYPPATLMLLRGLAAAIEDSGSAWRPLFSELARILSPSSRHDLLAMGGAYGAAKFIQPYYPGPALLLYGAIVDRLYGEEDTALTTQIKRAREKLSKASVVDDEDVKATLKAATDQARMGRISEAMRKGFAEGLSLSGRDQADAKRIASDIVKTTHDVRHRAQTDKYLWASFTPVSGVYGADMAHVRDFGTTSAFQRTQGEDAFFAGFSQFQQLVTPAQDACSQLLLHNLESLRTDG